VRVALWNPPSPFLIDDRVFPPLGLLQVAAACEEAGHEVSVLDLAGEADAVAQCEHILNTQEFDVHGISATTPQFPTAVALCRAIKTISPNQKVILGGRHATDSPESCGLFDVVVRGDGERAILQALLPEVSHVIDEATTTKKGLLDWHVPARHLIDMESYRYSINGLKGTSMMLSQGCSFGCLFCSGRTIPYYRRVRTRSIDSVVREMEALIEQYDMRAVMAFDDEVNLQSAPLLEFCQKIAPLNMKFRAFVKANLFTDQQAEAMAKAGFVEVCTGVESGSNRILGVIDKQTTREINKRFVDLAHKHGMRGKAFCSLGHPSESFETAEETKSWLIETHPDDFDITVLTIYPGTPIWEKREHISFENERSICRYVKHSKRPEEDGATLFFEEVNYAEEFCWYKGVPGAYVSHVWTPDLSKTDLVKLRDQIEDDVRKALGIPYPLRYSGDQFDHSMGQGVAVQDSRVALRE